MAAIVVRRVTEDRVRSALPGAPACSEPARRPRPPAVAPRTRRRLAGALRRAADRFEPVAE